MAFHEIPGRTGRFFIPEDTGGKKKHPCKDCFNCQFCDDDRCRYCLKREKCNSCEKKSDEGNNPS
ncbi:MAG TPA: hypothetical protein P5295_11865 [Spirochaetota bacterium]|nr:hypothetical protein [Spirochaetota bacterium]